jgi:hypothetical protein
MKKFSALIPHILFSSGSTAQQCSIQESNRSDCGFPGITQSACAALDCCWDDRTEGVPDCYRPADRRYECLVEPFGRQDAGYPGISERRCILDGYCWDDEIDGNPDCYKPDVAWPHCALSPASRRDCGYAGISGDACLDRGCCWDESIEDNPDCFCPEGADDCPPQQQPTASRTWQRYYFEVTCPSEVNPCFTARQAAATEEDAIFALQLRGYGNCEFSPITEKAAFDGC